MIELYGQPKTWWLTGLPAAGKSTLAEALKFRMMDYRLPICILDGDVIRQGLSADLGFSIEGRTEQIRRTAEVAKLLNDQGIWVAVALVSPIKAAREMARSVIGTTRFIEVYVSTSLEVCSARDPKGLYAKARINPNFGLTGAQTTFEPPAMPALVLDTASVSLNDCTNLLIDVARKNL